MSQNRRKYCSRLIAIIEVKRMIFDAPLPGNSVVAAYNLAQHTKDERWLPRGSKNSVRHREWLSTVDSPRSRHRRKTGYSLETFAAPAVPRDDLVRWPSTDRSARPRACPFAKCPWVSHNPRVPSLDASANSATHVEIAGCVHLHPAGRRNRAKVRRARSGLIFPSSRPRLFLRHGHLVAHAKNAGRAGAFANFRHGFRARR